MDIQTLSMTAGLDYQETRNGISVIFSEGEISGSNAAKKLLYQITGPQTVLFLSGGKTPANLYFDLAREEKLKLGAAALVDERYGNPLHSNSNELMILNSGLRDYFKRKNIPFYPVLETEDIISSTALHYAQTVARLFSSFRKFVAVLGIGEDGHIAGILPNRTDFINPIFSEENDGQLVSYFIDSGRLSMDQNSVPSSRFGGRITLTFEGLSKMDALIVLAFGARKQNALSDLFREGPFENLPARWLRNPDIAAKTTLITDRKI